MEKAVPTGSKDAEAPIRTSRARVRPAPLTSHEEHLDGLRAMANTSPLVRKQLMLVGEIQHSPRMQAQQALASQIRGSTPPVAQLRTGEEVLPGQQMKPRVPVNDDQGLEHEADVMGARALQTRSGTGPRRDDALHASMQGRQSSTKAGPADVLQRVVKITFQESPRELDPFDTQTAVITKADATRDKRNIAQEDEGVAAEQGAHVTSNVVFTTAIERGLTGKTWAEAWDWLREMYQFLDVVLTEWYKLDISFKINRTIQSDLPAAIKDQIALCDEQLTRGKYSIKNPLWAVISIDPDEKHQWFDRDPSNRGFDPGKYTIQQWEPSLRTGPVRELEDACELWITLRGQMPWTSLKEKSYIRGDVAGPPAVENALPGRDDQFDTNAANVISQAMLKTFDFFPQSFTKTRTSQHAAAVAARHVVEHFKYHPDIKPGWYDEIAKEFLAEWFEKVKRESRDQKRKTSALLALAQNWDTVAADFNRFRGQFQNALPQPSANAPLPPAAISLPSAAPSSTGADQTSPAAPAPPLSFSSIGPTDLNNNNNSSQPLHAGFTPLYLPNLPLSGRDNAATDQLPPSLFAGLAIYRTSQTPSVLPDQQQTPSPASDVSAPPSPFNSLPAATLSSVPNLSSSAGSAPGPGHKRRFVSEPQTPIVAPGQQQTSSPASAAPPFLFNSSVLSTAGGAPTSDEAQDASEETEDAFVEPSAKRQR